MAVTPPEPSTLDNLNTFYISGFQGKRKKAFFEYLGFTGFGFRNWQMGFGEDLQGLNPDKWELLPETIFGRKTPRIAEFTWLLQAPFRYAAFAIKVPIKAAIYLTAGIVKFSFKLLGAAWDAAKWIGGKVASGIKNCVDLIKTGASEFSNGKTRGQKAIGVLKVIGGVLGITAILGAIAGVAVSAVYGGPLAIAGIAGLAKSVAALPAIHSIGTGIAAAAQATAAVVAPHASIGGMVALGQALVVPAAIYTGVTCIAGTIIRKTKIGSALYWATFGGLGWLAEKAGKPIERWGKNGRLQNIAEDRPAAAPVPPSSQQSLHVPGVPAAQSSHAPSVNTKTPGNAAVLPGYSASSGEGLQGRGKRLTEAEAIAIKDALPSIHKDAVTVKNGSFHFHGHDDRVAGDAALAVKRAAPQIQIVLNAPNEIAAVQKMARMQPEVLQKLDMIEIGSSPPRNRIVKGSDEFNKFVKDVVAAQSRTAQVTPIAPSPPASHKRIR